MISTKKTILSWVFYLTFCLTTLTIIQGCDKKEKQTDLDDSCSKFSKLSYLKETSHPELRKEYALLVEQKHTPRQLVELDNNPNKNTAATFRRVLRKSKAEEILDETFFLTRRNHFQFNRLHLSKIKKLVKDYGYKIDSINNALKLPNCRFEYKHSEGPTANKTFINQVFAAVRLQKVFAANYLYNKPKKEEKENTDTEQSKEKNATNVDPALQKTIDCTEAIFKLANRLGRVKHVEARLTAALIREEADEILEAVVHDPRCNKDTLILIQKIIQYELAHWQSDADMWIGDRALGLYVYEIVRDGLILTILTDEEKESFLGDGTLDHLTETTQETADEDQLYYLTTMRNVISNCRRDFHKRPLLGSKIIEDLDSQKNLPSYPIVAAKLLLSEIDKALLLQMIDLARTRAWSVALSIAIGEEPKNNINPINGQPYSITETNKTVIVRAVGKDENLDQESPLNRETRLFIANQLSQPVVVPKPRR